MTTPMPPTPTPTPTPVPEGLATEVRSLGEQVDELSNHPCVEFDEYINPSTNELELGFENEDTPCSENDSRFAGGDWQRRKRCLQCFAQNEYGVTINAQSAEFSAEEVRILVRALIQVRNILSDRIRIECSDITVPPDVFQRLFGDEIIFELIAERPSSSETTENGVIIRLADDDIMSLGNPESSAIELAGNETDLEWLIFHELGHGFHNQLGFCEENDCDPIVNAGGFDFGSPVPGMPVVVWEYLRAIGEENAYYNATGQYDYGYWLRPSGYQASDPGIIELTSLNFYNGNPIPDWYQVQTPEQQEGGIMQLNGQQGNCNIQEQDGKQFVYVMQNASGNPECINPNERIFVRPSNVYIAPYDIDVASARIRFPNETRRSTEPTEGFSDSFAHFVRHGSTNMATTLGSSEPNLDARSRFFRERFCGWISELLNKGVVHELALTTRDEKE